MKLHRALSASLACAVLAVAVGCESYRYPGPQYMGSSSERAMYSTVWQVTGEESPQVPMPPPEPVPVPPSQQGK